MATPVYGPEVYGRPAYSDLLADQEVYGNGPLDEEVAAGGSGSFTADAVVFRTQAGSTTANAVLRRSGSGSLTADATVRRTLSSSLTADAVRLRTGSGSLTADALLFVPGAATFTVDAALARTTAGSLTVNATKLATRAGSTTANADLFKALAGSLTANATLLTGRTGSLTADARLATTISGSFIADAVIANRRFTADAVVSGRRFTADAAKRGTQSSSFTANAVRRKTVTNGTSTVQVGVDSSGLANGHHSFRTNTVYASLVAGTYVGFGDGQAHLEVGQRLSAGLYYHYESKLAFDTDTAGIPSGATIISAFLDLFGRTDNSVTNFDVYVYQYNWSANTDYLKASDLAARPLVATWNSFDYAASYRRFTDLGMAAVIVTNAKTRLILASGQYGVSAPTGESRVAFRDGFDGGGTTGPRLTITYSSGTPFTADAVRKRTQTGSFTANAVISALRLTANAVKRKTVSGSFTANAIVEPVLVKIFGDNFNRTTTPTGFRTGGPWSWHPYDSFSGDVEQVKAYTDGTRLVEPNQPGDWYDSYVGYPLPLTGDAYFDYWVPAAWTGNGRPTYGLTLDPYNYGGIFVRFDNDPGQAALTQLLSDTTFVFTPTPSTMYRVHARWDETTVFINSWPAADAEPAGWQYEEPRLFDTWAVIGTLWYVPPLLDLYYFPADEDGYLDNVEIWTSDATWVGFGGFQVQAVLVPRGQGAFAANAVKRKTISGSFTANAVIRVPGFTADAVIGQSPTRTVIARAALRKAQSASFTGDATFTSDGRVYGGFTASAHIFAPGYASFSADANFVSVNERDPGRGQGTGGGNAGGGASGGQGNNLDLFIRVDGVDITDNVKYDMTKFIGSVSGRPGEFEMVVVDRDHIYDFVSNTTVTVDVGGRRVWAGYASVVTATFAFLVDDTTDPDDTTRWWILSGPDVNVLFAKRLVYDKVNPANGNLHKWDPDTADGTIIRYVVGHYTDLPGDGVTLDVNNVGTPVPDKRGPGGAVPGRTFGEFMYYVSQLSGGIGYIDPTYVLHYEDDDTETAPFRLSDRPDGRSNYAGVAEFRMMHSGSQLINDALVWGAGEGKKTMTFSRAESNPSINEHGRWQEGDLRYDAYRQSTVNRIADSYVYGSPQNLRGHKDNQPIYRMRVFRDGLTAGMKVRVESEVFGVTEVIPIRLMTITFPTPYNPVFDLECSHELDAIWSMAEFPPLPRYPSGDGGNVPPGGEIPGPWDPPVDVPGGCDDCGITDDLERTIAASEEENHGWGQSLEGTIWTGNTYNVGVYADGQNGVLKIYQSPETPLVPGWDEVYESEQFLNWGYEAGPLDGLVELRLDRALAPSDGGPSDFGDYISLFFGDGPPFGVGKFAIFITGQLGMQIVPWDDPGESTFVSLAGIDMTEPFKVRATHAAAGEDFEVRVWQSTDSEPSSPTLSYTGTTFSNHGFTISISTENSALAPLELRLASLNIEGVTRCGHVQFEPFERQSLVVGTIGDSLGVTSLGQEWFIGSATGGATAEVDGVQAELHIPAHTFSSTPQFINAVIDDDGPWRTATGWTMTSMFTPMAGNGLPGFQYTGWAIWDGSFTDLVRVDSANNVVIATGAPNASTPFDISPTGSYMLKWEYVPNVSSKVKIWEVGTAEPGSWLITAGTANVNPAVSGFEIRAGNVTTSASSGATQATFYWIDFDYDGKPCYYGGCENVFEDPFDRALALGTEWGNGWGIPALDWENSANFAVSSSSGRIYDTLPTTGFDPWQGYPVYPNALPVSGLPLDGVVRFRINTPVSPGTFDFSLYFYTLESGDIANWGSVEIFNQIDGTLHFLAIHRPTPGTSSTLVSTEYVLAAGTWEDEWLHVRLRVEPDTSSARVWYPVNPEPSDWQTVHQRDRALDASGGLRFVVGLLAFGDGYSADYDLVSINDCGLPTSENDPSSIGEPPGSNSYGCETAVRLSSTVYETTYQIVPGSSQVTVDGLTFASGIDYTTSGNLITFTHPVTGTPVVYVCYRGA